MPFMPRKGEEATEFQTYALARCVYACKDHIDFTARYQAPIPPSHYLFNITQHLLVAGALLLLICHRGLQDSELLDRTIKDVDACIEVLKVIGQRFVGGTIGAEMLQNMKDNMKHSETWKIRQRKIAEAEAAKAAGATQSQGPLFPPMPLPGSRRISSILQPSSSSDVPSSASASTRAVASQVHSGDQTVPVPAYSHGSGIVGNTPPTAQGPAAFVRQYTGNTMMSSYSAHEPGYLYPVQPPPVPYPVSEWQASSLMGQGMTPPNNGTSFLDDYLQMSGGSYAGNTSHMHPSMMQTYNTPESQPQWPSDNLNFNIKGLEEITARSYNSSFMNMGNASNGSFYPGSSSNHAFFQF